MRRDLLAWFLACFSFFIGGEGGGDASRGLAVVGAVAKAPATVGGRYKFWGFQAITSWRRAKCSSGFCHGRGIPADSIIEFCWNCAWAICNRQGWWWISPREMRPRESVA